MLESTHASIHQWVAQKFEQTKATAADNVEKYAVRLLWFSCLLSIVLVLSPMSSDFVMNIGVAGVLFLSENIMEKHFTVNKNWSFAYAAAQIMLVASMFLGLPFGIDKDYTFWHGLGCVALIGTILFATDQLSYSTKERCRKERETKKPQPPQDSTHNATKGPMP